MGRHRDQLDRALDQADVLVTDAGLAPDARATLSEAVRELIVVDPAPRCDASRRPCPLTRARPVRRSPAWPASRIGATTRSRTSGSSSPPGGRGVRGSGPRSPTRSSLAWPSIPIATCAPAIRGPTGTSTREYQETYVFPNDFSALRPDTSMAEFDDGFLRAQGERGSCRVVCFSPRHDLTLGKMDPADVRRVIDVWAEQTSELGAEYRWVQVFENRGEAMGASNPHPHGQVWAGTALPGEAAREDAAQRRHLDESGRRLLLEYIGPRIGQPAGRGGERGLAGGRPVLGDLAIRDARHPEAARGASRRARRHRPPGIWSARCRR